MGMGLLAGEGGGGDRPLVELGDSPPSLRGRWRMGPGRWAGGPRWPRGKGGLALASGSVATRLARPSNLGEVSAWRGRALPPTARGVCIERLRIHRPLGLTE